MLELRNLTKSYGGPSGRRVLNGMALRVGPGEYVAIVGESGVGKSTLLNLIAGLDVPTAASCARRTRPRAARRGRAHAVRRTRIGFVFQAFHLLPHLTVARNVALPLPLSGQSGRAGDERCANCWTRWVSPTARRASRANCPAARCSAWPWHARWCTARAGARRRADRQPRSGKCRDDPGDAARADQARQRGRHAGHAFRRRSGLDRSAYELTRAGLTLRA